MCIRDRVQVRRQKLADLQAAGNDPFTLTQFPQDAYSADLKEEFKELPNETDSGTLVALAGRMMSKRVMGKASFAHRRDDKGCLLYTSWSWHATPRAWAWTPSPPSRPSRSAGSWSAPCQPAAGCCR